jgi:hypothetical protein
MYRPIEGGADDVCMRRCAWMVLVCLGAIADARAGHSRGGQSRPAPLDPIPPGELAPLAPLLVDRDLLLIEPNAHGGLKQILALTLVAAPPALVREVVVHPERYKDFVRNMKRSRVVVEPGGTLWHDYLIHYGVYSVDGHHRYVLLPKGPNDAVAPVDMYDPDADGTRHYRWEFLPAGDATVLALYGAMSITRDRFTSPYVNAAPTLESGFVMIPHLTLLYSMKRRAEQLAGGKVPLPAGRAAGWERLLARGTVAFLRATGGRLREISLIERSTASPQSLLSVAGDPARWSKFVPTMRRSTSVSSGAEVGAVEIEQSLPLMHWTSTWAHVLRGSNVDLVAVDGDLRGGHLRWDVVPDGGGAQVILRAIADFQTGSMLLRQVYKLEPYLEYGFDIALHLLLLRSVRQQAESLDHSSATQSSPSTR